MPVGDLNGEIPLAQNFEQVYFAVQITWNGRLFCLFWFTWIFWFWPSDFSWGIFYQVVLDKNQCFATNSSCSYFTLWFHNEKSRHHKQNLVFWLVCNDVPMIITKICHMTILILPHHPRRHEVTSKNRVRRVLQWQMSMAWKLWAWNPSSPSWETSASSKIWLEMLCQWWWQTELSVPRGKEANIPGAKVFLLFCPFDPKADIVRPSSPASIKQYLTLTMAIRLIENGVCKLEKTLPILPGFCGTNVLPVECTHTIWIVPPPFEVICSGPILLCFQLVHMPQSPDCIKNLLNDLGCSTNTWIMAASNCVVTLQWLETWNQNKAPWLKKEYFENTNLEH